MNILFFLKPKADLVFIYEHYTLRQALEKMKHHGYTAIPVIDKAGHYIGDAAGGRYALGQCSNIRRSTIGRASSIL